MADQLPPVPPDIAKLTGPIFLGMVFNWGLLGVLTVQTYIYYLGFPNDRRIPKIIVAGVYIVELVQTILMTKDGFEYFGSGWGNLIAFDNVGILWLSVPVLTGVLSSVVQFFYAWRIWIIGRSIYVPIVIGILSLAQLGGGIGTGVNAVRIHFWTKLNAQNQAATTVWLGGTAACDTLVTLTMFYLLSKSKSDFRSTNALLVKFIRLTVETGLVTTTFALLDLIFFLVSKENYHLTPSIALSKLYSNSLMVLLNARIRILNGRPIGFTTTDQTLSWLPGSTMSQQSAGTANTYNTYKLGTNRPHNRGMEISVNTDTLTSGEQGTMSFVDDRDPSKKSIPLAV
ncbi:hypothetical protein V5O48_015234 [Marasmius crinis-equi]|uniref:DUF6534 domain-containing protein n=1 Tax=Marasmius crinis-equi TaxID=585013 RepID=A0ABR3EV42_9AGAR